MKKMFSSLAGSKVEEEVPFLRISMMPDYYDY
jgi:hypothetical protein